MKLNSFSRLSVSILGGAILVAGCGQTPTASTANSTTVAQSDAPQGSTKAEAEAKSGTHQHSSASAELEAHTHATKLLFASSPSAIPAGKPTTWTLQINDAKSGAPTKDFSVVHEQLMHLIVVSRDLSWFNHLHPKYLGNGTFKLTATLPRAGNYKLYADYTPKGGQQEVAPHEFATVGASATAKATSLVPDKMNGAWLTKRVTAHPEGEPDTAGGPIYEVALMPMPFAIKAGEDVMLHFQVRDAKGQPVKDLQPYLGAMGHATVLSSDTKQYLHSHPTEGGASHDMSQMSDMSEMKHDAPPRSGGPDVMFHTNLPAAGLYKAWGQFKHRGQIITAGFVLRAGETDASGAKGTAQ